MKTLKITLATLFSIGLLTAVLPSSETELTLETSNHEVNKSTIKLTAMIDKTKIKVPDQG